MTPVLVWHSLHRHLLKTQASRSYKIIFLKILALASVVFYDKYGYMKWYESCCNIRI